MLGNRYSRPQYGIRKNNGEFPYRCVFALYVVLHRHCHKAQNLVAGQVAEVVVESLEVIDVREHQRHRFVCFKRFRYRLLQSDVKEFSIS